MASFTARPGGQSEPDDLQQAGAPDRPRHMSGRSRPAPPAVAPATSRRAPSGPARLVDDAATSRESGAWVNHGERTVWTSSWFDVAVADVSPPGGQRGAHDLVRSPSDEVACFAADHAGQVLLVRRHRFAIDRWGWELPTTALREGEDGLAAAVRVAHDDCGWAIEQPRLSWSAARWPQHADLLTYLVVSRAFRRVGPPSPNVGQVGWLDRRDVRQLLDSDQVLDLFTAAALHWWIAWA